MKYKVTFPDKEKILRGTINLTASKSESNRALIVRALSETPFKINNLASADDTRILEQLLNSAGHTLDVGPAGTTMRFLTAYLATSENSEKIITGSQRMQERPIGILVDALNHLGADITYLKNAGFPPLKVRGKKLSGKQVTIDGSVSSQYITALILIAPILENGLIIKLQGKIASKPYIMMTLKMLEFFGVKSEWSSNNIITIPHQEYQTKEYSVEGDWSSASYLYSVAAMSSRDVDLTINGLHRNSLQGDAAISEIMDKMGIQTDYTENGIHLSKKQYISPELIYDFSNCPDIAQTVAVASAGLKIKASLDGLESLKIKETDRVQALINELTKMGIEIKEIRLNSLEIMPAKALKEGASIHTYQDHRMAMAFAPLAIIIDSIIIEDPMVVTKSYPDFWRDLTTLGFNILKINH